MAIESNVYVVILLGEKAQHDGIIATFLGSIVLEKC